MGFSERIRHGDERIALHGLLVVVPMSRRLVWTREILWSVSIAVALFTVVAG